MFIWLIRNASQVPLCVAVMFLLLGISFFATTLMGIAPPDARLLRGVAGTVIRKNTACDRFGCSMTGVDLQAHGMMYGISFRNCARARQDVEIGDNLTIRFIPDQENYLGGQAYAVEGAAVSWCGVGDALDARAQRYRIDLYISGLIMLVGLLALSRSFFGRLAELGPSKSAGWRPRLPTTSYLRGDDKYEVKL